MPPRWTVKWWLVERGGAGGAMGASRMLGSSDIVGRAVVGWRARGERDWHARAPRTAHRRQERSDCLVRGIFLKTANLKTRVGTAEDFKQEGTEGTEEGRTSNIQHPTPNPAEPEPRVKECPVLSAQFSERAFCTLGAINFRTDCPIGSAPRDR